MVDSMCIHKPNGTLVKNTEMLKFVPDHLKPKQM